jgi:hypothetical protein
VSYLRTADKPLTDGDAMLQLEVAVDTIAEERAAFKAIFRTGIVSSDELTRLNAGIDTLRTVSSKLLAAAEYFEKRERNA